MPHHKGQKKSPERKESCVSIENAGDNNPIDADLSQKVDPVTAAKPPAADG